MWNITMIFWKIIGWNNSIDHYSCFNGFLDIGMVEDR